MNRLKVDKSKNFNKSNYIIIGAGLSVSLLSLYLYVQAKNNNFLNNNLKNDSKNNLAILVDGVKQDEFPAKYTGYSFDSFTCKNGTSGGWSNSDWSLSMNFSSADSCIINFKKADEIKILSVDVYNNEFNSQWRFKGITLSKNSQIDKFDFKAEGNAWETYAFREGINFVNYSTNDDEIHTYFIRVYTEDGAISDVYEGSFKSNISFDGPQPLP